MHPSDAGVYVCEASNLMGKIVTSAELKVSERPVITVRPKAHMQEPVTGKQISLECMVTGTPKPIVYWAREGDDAAEFIMPGMRRNNMYVTSDGALKIESPEVGDSGHYACAAVNEVGSAIARSHLVVFNPEDFEKNNNNSNNIDTYAAESDFSTAERFAKEEARLALLEQTVGRVEALPLGPSTIKISWKMLLEEGSAARYVDGFRVHYRRRRTDRYENFSAVTLPLSSSAAEFKIKGLEPYVEYEVFVQPYSKEVILGQPSSMQVVRTHADLPAAAPSIISAEMVNSSAAFVVWEKLAEEHRNGQLLGYQVSERMRAKFLEFIALLCVDP